MSVLGRTYSFGRVYSFGDAATVAQQQQQIINESKQIIAGERDSYSSDRVTATPIWPMLAAMVFGGLAATLIINHASHSRR